MVVLSQLKPWWCVIDGHGFTNDNNLFYVIKSKQLGENGVLIGRLIKDELYEWQHITRLPARVCFSRARDKVMKSQSPASWPLASRRESKCNHEARLASLCFGLDSDRLQSYVHSNGAPCGCAQQQCYIMENTVADPNLNLLVISKSITGMDRDR